MFGTIEWRGQHRIAGSLSPAGMVAMGRGRRVRLKLSMVKPELASG